MSFKLQLSFLKARISLKLQLSFLKERMSFQQQLSLFRVPDVFTLPLSLLIKSRTSLNQQLSLFKGPDVLKAKSCIHKPEGLYKGTGLFFKSLDVIQLPLCLFKVLDVFKKQESV